MLRLAGQLNGCARNGHQIAGLNGQARRRLRALYLNGCPGANLTVLIAGRAAIDTCNGNGSGVETCLARREEATRLAYLPACCSLATLTTSSVFSFSSSRSPLEVLASSGSPLNCQLMLGNGLPSASHSSTKDLPSLIVWFCGAIKISGKSVNEQMQRAVYRERFQQQFSRSKWQQRQQQRQRSYRQKEIYNSCCCCPGHFSMPTAVVSPFPLSPPAVVVVARHA